MQFVHSDTLFALRKPRHGAPHTRFGGEVGLLSGTTCSASRCLESEDGPSDLLTRNTTAARYEYSPGRTPVSSATRSGLSYSRAKHVLAKPPGT